MSVCERYVELCLRLARHDEDLLDYYYGPKEIAERIEREPPRVPAQLAADARALAEETVSAFLRAQLGGLEIVARKLDGEEIAYEDEVEACYGTRPQRTPEERFEEAHQALNEALPSGGTLAERFQRWDEGDPVPVERIEAVLAALAARLRQRTRELFGLPDGETFEFELVRDKHWEAFNDYRGGLRSNVEVNTDLPIGATSVVALVAHELYPGHHTEQVWKEHLLYAGREQLEESVLLYGTPQSVISEGIATLAVDLVVDEHGDLVAEALGDCGVEYDAERARQIRAAARPLTKVIGNAAMMLHVDGAPTDEAAAYLQRWDLSSPDRAEQHVEFVMDRWGRAYITTYTDGYDICRAWVDGDPARFKRLLTEQLTPADLK